MLRVRGASLTWVLVLSSLLLTGLNPAGATAGHAASAAASMPRPRHLRVPRAVPHAVPAAYGALPLSFEPNQGQTDPQVAFLARAPGYQLFLTASGAVLNVVSVQRSAPGRAILPGTALTGTTTISGTVLRLRYLGATAAPQIAGQDALPGTANYLVGAASSAWHTRIPTYEGVIYHDLYPGIDLGYDGAQGRLESSYTIAPGADPSAIQLAIAGAQSVQVDAHGALVLQTAQGSVIEAAPAAYQVSTASARRSPSTTS